MKRLTAIAALLAASAALMAVAKPIDSEIGRVWADESGMTLYVFSKDGFNVSNCYDACAAEWPPYLAAPGSVGRGDWTLISRRDGSLQWVVQGHPLYRFEDDERPGDAHGNRITDEFGRWRAVFAVAANDMPRTLTPTYGGVGYSAPSTGGSSGGGYSGSSSAGSGGGY